MRTEPESTPILPQINILSHPISPNIEITNPKVYHPTVPITIFQQKQLALIDTGATVSAISENLYNHIRNKHSEHELPVVPVTNLTLSTALHGKTVKIRSQIYLTFRIQTFTSSVVCLVVPDLSIPLIFGNDWLSENKVHIDYETMSVTLLPNGPVISFNTSSNLNFQTNVLNEIWSHEDICKDTKEKDPPICGSDFFPVDETERHDFETLLFEYNHIFSDRPGLHRSFTYKFKVREHVPYKIKPYPVPFAKRPAVQKEIDKMLEWGVIERSDAPYNNPLVTVGKSDGSIRLCLDARKLNTIILPTRDSSPPMDEILAKFNDKHIFSSLDFTSGYWQIPLDTTVRPYTSFLYDGRSYQFCVVPFGLNVSNAAFGKGLESTFENCSTVCPFPNDLHVYVDDLLIASKSNADHFTLLRWIFKKVSDAGLTLKYNKCFFHRSRIKFLGHFVSGQGLIIDPEKVNAIKNFPTPRNRKDLQSFFGFCNFYQKFSQSHSSLLHPLSHLLKKETPWSFTEKEQEVFDTIKSAFARQIALTFPNFQTPFGIQTDASLNGLGAELFQIEKDGLRHTIMFASRTLKGGERNYTITELELLSIVFACQKFRVYILGYPVFLYTDHKALIFLFSCKLRNARLSRWTLSLQEYHLQIHHCPGKSNVIDTLSRHPIDRDNIHVDVPRILGLLKYPTAANEQIPVPPSLPLDVITVFNKIVYEQSQDQHLVSIVKKLSCCKMPPWHKFYKIHEKILFVNKSKSQSSWSVCLPKHLIQTVVVALHDYYGHVGPLKTARAIKPICYFPSFRKKVTQIVQACDLCQRCKHRTTRIAGPIQNIISQKPLDKLLVDLFGPLPTGQYRLSYIFVILDNFSRYVKLYPLVKATAKACTGKLIKEYFPTYGTPKEIISDHGRQFISHLWQTNLNKNHIRVGHTSVYHPQSNPAERVMRELGRLFRTYCHENHNDWPQYVPYVEWVLNNVTHEATNHTPSELFLGGNTHNPIGQFVPFPESLSYSQPKKLLLANEIQLSKAEERTKRHNARLKPTTFQVNDLVLIRTHKLSNLIEKKISKFFMLYEGPYKVILVKQVNAYAVANPDNNTYRGTFNVTHMKRYLPPEPD